MPKTQIKEIDSTGLAPFVLASNVVYVPGATTSAVEPTLCETVAQLDAVPGIVKAGAKNQSYSYILAKRLIRLGLKVLFQGFVASQPVVDGDYSISISANDWKRLEDRNLYDIRFLTTGAFACPSKDMIACAAKRGDCIALLDHAKSVTPASGKTQVEAIRAVFEGLKLETADIATYGIKTTTDPNSFAAAFTPWFDANIDGASCELPASAGYLLAYARSIKTNPSWFAIAGSFRGIIPELGAVKYKYTTADVEQLQARASDGAVDLDETGDNVGIAINPISYVRPTGYIINGNRTMRENDATRGIIASSFLNVRNLVSEINKTMYEAANLYRYEQNDYVLWVNFTSQIIPLLERMKSNEGINFYKLVRLGTDKKGRVHGRLIISAIEAVEDFELEIYLSDSLDIVE